MRTIKIEITEFRYKEYRALMETDPKAALELAEDMVLCTVPDRRAIECGYGVYGRGCYAIDGKYFAYIDVGTSCD